MPATHYLQVNLLRLMENNEKILPIKKHLPLHCSSQINQETDYPQKVWKKCGQHPRNLVLKGFSTNGTKEVQSIPYTLKKT